MECFKQILLFFLFACSVVNLVSSERSTYIVHMDKSFMPKPFSSHQHWYSSILDSLKSTSPNSHQENPPILLYTYDTVLHGFSALLSRAELEALKKLLGLVSAYSDKVATLDTTHSCEFLSLNPFTGLWPASEYGKDVIVGVMDTGVWPESLSYKDDGMTEIPSRWKGGCDGGFDFNSSLCNKKLIGAKYFNKGVLAANPNNTKKMYSARDTDGHGTHTSSTVGGNSVNNTSFFGYALGTARGVAPRARLAIYKVIFKEWSYASDVLAGNVGTRLGYLHNGIPWVLTVAAASMDRWFAGSLTLGNGLTITGWSLFPARAFVHNSALIYSKTIAACNSTELLSRVSFGTVICDTSESFYSQIDYVSQSNVQAAIFISSYYTYEDSHFNYPGVIISPDEGAKVINYALKGKNPTATIKFQQTFVGTTTAPVVAGYTSRGPSPSYPGILKPDVMAPGTLVLASWIPNDAVSQIGQNIGLSNDFNLISGTSMACPHGAGIAALLKGAHPGWSPAAIRSAMVTTANPFDNTGNPIKDIGFNYAVATPISMGAGEVDPNSALDPGLIYNATAQDYINLLCSMNYTQMQILTIKRSNYNCSNQSSDLNYPSFIVLYTNGTSTKSVLTKKFERVVTNVGDGVATYKAKVTAPKGSDVSVYPETLVFGQKYDQQTYSLRIYYTADQNQTVTFGSVIWVEENGKHTVRSPIVVAPMIPVW
ncbi:hypothetical protein ACH5RR_034997 [Cinchona calisaya]|uniref:Subtilisin-like protease n=1 Tax=Cinchona calisaya TaxID=153742 RepID=A0ABD2YDW2_9GENT